MYTNNWTKYVFASVTSKPWTLNIDLADTVAADVNLIPRKQLIYY